MENKKPGKADSGLYVPLFQYVQSVKTSQLAGKLVDTLQAENDELKIKLDEAYKEIDRLNRKVSYLK